jgi:hypothetical protein
MLAKRMMWIAWPAFLVAGLFEVLVFGLVDPQDLEWFGHPLALSRQAVYTLSCFCFLGFDHGLQRLDDLAVDVAL